MLCNGELISLCEKNQCIQDGGVEGQWKQISPSASADSGRLLPLRGVVGVLEEGSAKVDIYSPNVRLSRGLFVWRPSVDDGRVSQHTSVAAFRFFSPLAPSADFFFFRGRVGLTSPRSKTSSGRLQL